MSLTMPQFLNEVQLELNSISGVYLFVCPWPLSAVGGVVQVVKELSSAMELDCRLGSGLMPLVWVPDWSCKRPKFEQHTSGVWVMRMRIPVLRSAHQPQISWFAQIKSHLDARRRASLLCEVFDSLRVEYLNFHYVNDMTESLLNWLSLAGLRDAVKLRLSFHGADVKYLEKVYLRGPTSAQRLLRSSGDKVVACSAALRLALLEFFLPEQVVVAYSGVNVRVLRSSAQKPFIHPDNKPYIIHVGKFTAAKGQLDLLRAFSMVYKQIPHHLVMVGASTGHYDEKELPELAEKLGVASRVSIFYDIPHDKIGSLMVSASALCLPSHHEAFGLVLMEAGVLGVPVIASDLGGIRECLAMPLSDDAIHCEYGTLVPVSDPLALSEAILSVTVTGCEQAQEKAAKYRDWLCENRQWLNTLGQYELSINTQERRVLNCNSVNSPMPGAAPSRQA